MTRFNSANKQQEAIEANKAVLSSFAARDVKVESEEPDSDIKHKGSFADLSLEFGWIIEATEKREAREKRQGASTFQQAPLGASIIDETGSPMSCSRSCRNQLLSFIQFSAFCSLCCSRSASLCLSLFSRSFVAEALSTLIPKAACLHEKLLLRWNSLNSRDKVQRKRFVVHAVSRGVEGRNSRRWRRRRRFRPNPSKTAQSDGVVGFVGRNNRHEAIS